MTVTLVNRQYC